MKAIFNDQNKYNKFIILLLVFLGFAINILLPYKSIKIDSELNFSTLFSAQNKIPTQTIDTDYEQIIRTDYFDKHNLFIENFSIFVDLAGSNVGYLFFIVLKLFCLYLIFKYLSLYTKDNKMTLIGIVLILNSAPFILISNNYLLDLVSITIYIFYLLQKIKFNNTKSENVDEFNNGYKNIVVFSLKSTILFSILIYINPLNLILIPFFLISTNIKNQKYFIIFGFCFTTFWIIISQFFGYSLISTFEILPKLLFLKLPNTFLLKNYLGILVFTLVFYYLILKNKWKSEIFGNKNIEFYLILILLFILPFISQYYVSLYIYLLLLMVILPNISKIIYYVFSSEVENQNAVINFLIFYYLINLYLVSNFH